MSKKLMIGAVAIVAAVVALGFLLRQHQKEKQLEALKQAQMDAPGCTVVDGKLYTNFAGNCYIFREKDGELVDVTMVAMDGHETGDNAFQGTLEVLDYEHSEEGFIEGTPQVTRAGGFYTVLDRKTCRHNETDADGNNKMVSHFTDYEFTYYVSPGNPRFLAVVIYEHLLDDYYVGILAGTEAEAKEAYQWFRENEP